MKKLLIALSLLLVAATSAFAADLPKPPEGAVATGGGVVAQCSETAAVYLQDYDLNPSTSAMLRLFGYFEISTGISHPPVGAILVDDTGNARVFIKEKGEVIELTATEFVDRFPNPCQVLSLSDIQVTR